MTDADYPFAAERYRLTTAGELRTLQDDEARSIAVRLAEMNPWRSLGSTPEGLEHYLTHTDPCLHRYALWQAERIIGVIAVRSPWLRGCFLELLSVFEEAQRQGMGRNLIEWLADVGQLAGANLWVTVSASNQRACCFYERHGFVPIGDIPDLIRAGSTEILLRRLLT